MILWYDDRVFVKNVLVHYYHYMIIKNVSICLIKSLCIIVILILKTVVEEYALMVFNNMLKLSRPNLMCKLVNSKFHLILLKITEI